MERYSKFANFNVSFPASFVAQVEVNRPDRLNAYDQMTWLQLGGIFNVLSVDSDVKAVILTAAGDRAFTAGLDVTPELMASNLGGRLEDERKRIQTRQIIRGFQDAISAIENCNKPVIGVAHGISFGLAIDILSAADVRICTSDVRFCVKEVDIGLAADIGTLQRFPKIVGSTSWCREVVFTACEFSATEALKHGFVSHVESNKRAALAAALKLAQVVVEKSPVAVQSSKHLMNYSRDRTVQDGLEYTAAWNAFAIGRDTDDAVAAFAMRKKPVFGKL
ncbi:ClpP/crotonase-like domain-containing protein [Limtongia smithiae]|uniref:ClpP/crotonase-like domain-containing protein n=1 Tax=Limtongia smithiae TaxID=1125753 RepID=UPI0034CF65BC